jgi:hypothetical protein
VLGAPVYAIFTRFELDPKRYALYCMCDSLINFRTSFVQVFWPACCGYYPCNVVINFEPNDLLYSWFMGADALQGNGITLKILYFFRDKALTPRDERLRKVRKSRILMFVAVQLVGFGTTFAITQTVGTYMYFLFPPIFYSYPIILSRHRFPGRHIITCPSASNICSSPTFYR